MTQNIPNSDTIEIVAPQPAKVKLEEGRYPGRFVNLRMETESKRAGIPRKDLILTVQLDKKGNAQPVTVDHVFNMLAGKRGKSHFKSCMTSFLEREVTDADLATFKKSEVVNKPVISKYKKNQLGNAVVFETYLPAN